MNTIGNLFRITSFGESHGAAIGGIIDGCPSGVLIDYEFIQSELDRRKPGQSKITTPRKEDDEIEFLSGIFEGMTTGVPIGFIIRNRNQHSKDYDNMKNLYRPSHADYTYSMKYGIRDHQGGGRSSARETIARVVAGAIAKLYLNNIGVNIKAYTSQVGKLKLEKNYLQYDLNTIENNIVRCPDQKIAAEMIDFIDQVRKEGDTIGGTITCVINGTPIGLGEPVFGKLHAALGHAMLTINACKGFEYGDGFDVEHRGSERNDEMYAEDGLTKLRTNHSGGIQGGISNGEDIYFRVSFKPVATILQKQNTIDNTGNNVELNAKGRHDPCVLPRAVPIVEAMAAITILDYLLLSQKDKASLSFN